MKTFIAFFDVLGFKEFINNNELEEVKRLFEHLLRESQTAVSSEKNIELSSGIIVPDLNNQKVNCLHISDSIIFWTNSDAEADFIDLVNTCYTFYWRSLKTTFPIRGCLTHGEIDFNPGTIKNVNGINFYNYSLIGKGLVESYQKAESIEYAGCLLDNKAVEKVEDKLINQLIYDQKICMYKVPFKTGYDYQLVFRPIKGEHNDVAFRNTTNRIKKLFTYSTKSDINSLSQSVKTKLNNTIDFISYFREVDSKKNPE